MVETYVSLNGAFLRSIHHGVYLWLTTILAEGAEKSDDKTEKAELAKKEALPSPTKSAGVPAVSKSQVRTMTFLLIASLISIYYHSGLYFEIPRRSRS